MTAKLRIAGIGCGYFSQFHYGAWQRLPVTRIALCDQQPGRATTAARRYGFAAHYNDAQAMLEQESIELLDIVTPPVAHLELISLAAARGIDVICQKPFCENLAQAREAVELARRAGIRLIVHENFRFQPWYREIHQLLDSGRLGELYTAHFRLRPGDGQGADAYLARQPGFQRMPRFLVHETGVHFVDLFRFLFGEIDEVYASLRRLNPAIDGEDAGHVLMGFDSGLQAHFDANRLVDHAANNCRLTMGELRIEGSDAELLLNGNGEIRLRKHGNNRASLHRFDWHDTGFGGDCDYLLQRQLIAGLTRDEPIDNSAAGYLRNLEIVEAIYTSATSGQRVNCRT